MTETAINTSRREFLGTSALVVSGTVLGVSAMANPAIGAADSKQNPFGLGLVDKA